IPALSAEAATVQITSSVGPVALISFTPGLSSCLSTSTSMTCTWSAPDSAAPQVLVISVPAGGAGTLTFNALSGPIGGTLVQKATTSVTVAAATTTVAGSTTTAATTTVAPTTVAPPPTEAPTTTVAPTTTASGSLPATGSNSGAPLVIALVAIAAGVLLVGGARLLKNKS
ncbi:MAG TPA: hypothetical protein VMK16_12850, partial [Acidimicrobiales bacterium]|nr:hypothetical protein [Acidimicrobiales bacterium]